jgi:hypothetical protein
MLSNVKATDKPRNNPSKNVPGKYQLNAIDNAKHRIPIGKRRSSLPRTKILTQLIL